MRVWRVIVHLRASMKSSTRVNQHANSFRPYFGLLTGAVVKRICLLIFAGGVGFDGLLDRLDGPAEEVRVAHNYFSELYLQTTG